MPYTLVIDSPENFECSLQLEGASLSKSFARLVIETNSLPFAMVFNGTISANGKCSIPIAKLKEYLSENCNGSMVLEVVADSDTYFEAWRDTFSAKISKKVVVTEVTNTKKEFATASVETAPVVETKPRVIVSEIKGIHEDGTLTVEDLGKNLGILLSQNNVTIETIGTSNTLIETFIKQNNQYLTQGSVPRIIEIALHHLSL